MRSSQTNIIEESSSVSNEILISKKNDKKRLENKIVKSKINQHGCQPKSNNKYQYQL